jgi:hypothetical protein
LQIVLRVFRKAKDKEGDLVSLEKDDRTKATDLPCPLRAIRCL